MKIRIEYDVPEGDCRNCEHSSITGFNCRLFNIYSLEKDDNGKWIPCQRCIDATVKEGE